MSEHELAHIIIMSNYLRIMIYNPEVKNIQDMFDKKIKDIGCDRFLAASEIFFFFKRLGGI